MKMIYGGTPVKSLKVKHYEMDTNSCDMIASDLQTGKTAVARGQKITGTGKSFEFAYYGRLMSNDSLIIPINEINIVHVSSLDYPVHSTVKLLDMKYLDFSTEQIIGNLIFNNLEYPVSVLVQNNEISIFCDIDANFEIFFGKDNYI